MRFPARLDHAIFYSHGCKLLGGLYGTEGDSPRPTVILLHGVPGVEKNLDIAHALREAGWNCLYFHYRGCWGSEGNYSLGGLADDVRAATEWVLSQPSVDSERLVVGGSSIGGYAALVAGAADLRFKAIISICPLIDPAARSLSPKEANEFALMLNGVTGEQLEAQWNSLPPITNLTTQLSGRPILLATAEQDELFPPEHYLHFVKSNPQVKWIRIPDADHQFSTCRRQVARAIIEWVDSAF